MNINLVLDTSNFKPFDISPRLQILHDYRDAYNQKQELINKIIEENGQYSLPDTPENKQYIDIINAYDNDLRAVADDFLQGMNVRNSTDLMNIYRRQRREVAPIHKAIEAYNKNVDKLASLGPDALVGNKDALSKISTYYGGVNPGIEYRSHKTIQQTAAGIMQGLDNALMSAPAQAGSIANQYFLLKQQGIDGQKALSQILNSHPGVTPEDAGELLAALNKVYDSYAFADGTPENNGVWKDVVTGAIMGIQAPKYSIQTDRSYETPSDRRQIAYQEAQMLKNGYVYNPSTGKYEYDEEAAATADGAVQTTTLPDGSTWNYDPKKKQWTSPDATWDGVPRTSPQLIQERKRQIDDQQKQDQLNLGEVGKRTEEQYLELGRRVAPLNYRGWSSSSNWEYQEGDSGYYYNKWYGDNEKLSDSAKEKIKPEVKMDILSKLKEQNPELNIGWEDLDIYEDSDLLSNNHYRVVIKGTGERGVYQGNTRTETPASTTREEVPADNTLIQRNDSTTVVKRPNPWG